VRRRETCGTYGNVDENLVNLSCGEELLQRIQEILRNETITIKRLKNPNETS